MMAPQLERALKRLTTALIVLALCASAWLAMEVVWSLVDLFNHGSFAAAYNAKSWLR